MDVRSQALRQTSDPPQTFLPIEIGKWHLTHLFLEFTKHCPFSAARIVCGRPVDPKIAIQEQNDLTASMRASVPALLSIELPDTFLYWLIRFSDVDDRFVPEPSLRFKVTVDNKVGIDWFNEW